MVQLQCLRRFPTTAIIACNESRMVQLQCLRRFPTTEITACVESHNACRKKIAESEKARLFEDDAIEPGFDVDRISVWSTETGDTSLQSWKKLAVLPVQP